MFRVANQEYDISSAYLKLFDDEDDEGADIICWGVRIIGKSRSDTDDMARWDPAIHADVLLQTKPTQTSHWYEIAGTTVTWNEPDEDPHALFEVFESEAIYNCKWQFVRTPDASTVRLVLDGTVDVDVDHEKLPIHVDTQLGVAPLPMGRLSEAECYDRFRKLGLDDPVQYKIQEGGVSSLVFLNQPEPITSW